MDESREARIQSNPTVTVRGVGIARVRPDGVRIGLTVRHRAEASDEALAEAARQAEALEELFRQFGIDEGQWVTAWLGLQEWTEWEESSRRETRDARRETRDARRETRDARRETRDARRETRDAPRVYRLKPG